MKINIPKTIGEAQAALGDLDELITAKEWSRAAIVWAFTTPGKGGRRTARSAVQLSIREFCGLGIHGLASQDTVRAYRQAWEWAIINHDAADVQAGERADLPDVEWPGRQDDAGQRRYVEQDPGAIARAMSRGKVDVTAFAQDVDADTAAAIMTRFVESRPGLVAEAVAHSAGAQRAIARNERARDGVEHEGIQVRANQPLDKDEQDDMHRKVRRGSHELGTALGLDEVVEYLRGAAREIGHAVYAAEEYGVRDTDGEAEALARIKRLLALYEGRATWTGTDDEWAAQNGVKL